MSLPKPSKKEKLGDMLRQEMQDVYNDGILDGMEQAYRSVLYRLDETPSEISKSLRRIRDERQPERLKNLPREVLYCMILSAMGELDIPLEIKKDVERKYNQARENIAKQEEELKKSNPLHGQFVNQYGLEKILRKIGFLPKQKGK